MGLQPAASNILTRLPRNPDQGIFTWKSALLIIAQGLTLAGIALAVFVINFVGLGVVNEADNESLKAVYNDALLHARAHAFIALCCMHLWQAFMSRSVTLSIFRQSIYNNKWLVAGVAISFSLLVACMYIPGWNTAFDQYPLDGYDWIIVLSCLVVQTAMVELIKFVLRRNCFMEHRKPKANEKMWYTAI